MVCTVGYTYKKEQVLKIHLGCIANALFPKCMKLVCISPMRLRILFHMLSHQKSNRASEALPNHYDKGHVLEN